MLHLALALVLSFIGHYGQKDKGGAYYFWHPFRVMLSVNTLDQKIVALLHDIIEDSRITHLLLSKLGFSSPILEALNLLTRKPGQSYSQYLDGIKPNPLANVVKFQDLRDNINVLRLNHPVTKSDFNRIKKYCGALQFLCKPNLNPD